MTNDDPQRGVYISADEIFRRLEDIGGRLGKQEHQTESLTTAVGELRSAFADFIEDRQEDLKELSGEVQKFRFRYLAVMTILGGALGAIAARVLG